MHSRAYFAFGMLAFALVALMSDPYPKIVVYSSVPLPLAAAVLAMALLAEFAAPRQPPCVCSCASRTKIKGEERS